MDITYESVNKVLMDKSNPLEEMFQTEELWLDFQVKDGIIAIVSNFPHPEITETQAKRLHEYLKPHVGDLPVYLPDGPIEHYHGAACSPRCKVKSRVLGYINCSRA